MEVNDTDKFEPAQVQTDSDAEEGSGNQSLDADETENAADSEQQVAALRSQVQELENRLLRAQADFDNFRRRSRIEREDLLKYSAAKLVTDLLPVLDNFHLALGAETSDADSLKKGIDMVFRQLQTVLEQEGLAPMQPVGQPFDPIFHEAVLQVEHESADPGIVIDEMRKGYLLKDKVIRPAMVKVSI
ncbi:MAG: grpE [Bacilli bacterium]|nr:grpE [Bacilli bacterium]